MKNVISFMKNILTKRPIRMVVTNSRSKVWLDWSKKDVYYHREDGPAVIFKDGTKMWFIENYPHRIDGPAIEVSNNINRWFIHGNELKTNEVENWIEEDNINLKTEEGQMLFKLRWA